MTPHPSRSRSLSLATLFAGAATSVALAACAEPPEPDPEPRPSEAAELATSVAQSALAQVIPESVTVGTSLDLDAYAGEEGFALPPGEAMNEIVGMAIAKSNDHVYTWFANGTVASGYSKDLDLYSSPSPFSLPGTRTADDLLGTGIATNGGVYAWYDDGTVSSGYSADLDFYTAPVAFTVAAGETLDDLVAIDFASDDRVYAWYRDGKRSVGSITDLDLHSPAIAFALPPGQKTSHVVETAIASDDRVYTWFQDLESGLSWPAIADAVDGIIVDRLRQYRGAGATVAISKNGRIVMERAYGYRDASTQESRMPWHRSKIGSVSKVITALGVIKHAEQSPSFNLTSKVYGSNGVLSDVSYVQAMVAGINRHKPLVGFAISPTDRVWAWYENQTVSSGNTGNLAANTAAAPFTLPAGKTTNDILAIAMASDGDVYTWYKNGHLSIGTPTNLGSISPGAGAWQSFEPAANMGTSQVTAIAIRKSDNRVFAWYLDGTYSAGNSTDLDSVAARDPYSPAAGTTIYDLRDADFASTGVAYFHYGARVSAGTPADLDATSGTFNSTLASAPIVNDWLAWYGAMEIRHLLNHSSGLWGGGDQSAAAHMFGVDLEDLTYPQINQYVLATRRLLWAPAADEDYSNHGVGLAGHALATSSGMSVGTFIRTRLFAPLGLTQIVPNGTGDRAYDATPHSNEQDTQRLITQTLEAGVNDTGLASGGYSATAGDLVRLMLATDQLGNHPDILAPSSLNLMETPPFPATVSNRALGWDYSNGRLDKGGDIAGGNAHIVKFPAGYMLGGVNVGGMTIALAGNGGVSSSELRAIANLIAPAAAPIVVDASYDLY
jgi:CubicO group peptidase (beta-lactamase class C family)